MRQHKKSEEELTQQSQEDLELQLLTEKKRSEEYLTRLKYMQADLENMRKRCDRQIQEVSQYSTERLIIQLLDVVDELELAIKTAQTAKSAQTLIEGVQMTLKRLRKVLELEGVIPIESVGKPFDPSRHNAVIAEERDDVETCVVIEEIRKGYIMKEKVIRPSMVKVAVKKSQSQKKEEIKISQPKSAEKILGIDLGTTNSAAAIYENGDPPSSPAQRTYDGGEDVSFGGCVHQRWTAVSWRTSEASSNREPRRDSF
jgi:molecular chaperone GrpE